MTNCVEYALRDGDDGDEALEPSDENYRFRDKSIPRLQCIAALANLNLKPIICTCRQIN